MIPRQTPKRVRQRALGVMPGRVTYVIDKEGVIRLVFSAQFAPRNHVSKVREALRQAI